MAWLKPSQSAFAGYGLEGNMNCRLKLGLESQSAFAGYGLEAPTLPPAFAFALTSQSAFAGYGLEVIEKRRTSIMAHSRNPLSLDMGWKLKNTQLILHN